MRTMTIRLPDDQADDLNLIARVFEVPLIDVIRHALSAHIEVTCAASEFQDRLRQLVAADHERAKRLMTEGGHG